MTDNSLLKILMIFPLLLSCVPIIMLTYVMIVDLFIEISMMNYLLSSCVNIMRPFAMIPRLTFP